MKSCRFLTRLILSYWMFVWLFLQIWQHEYTVFSGDGSLFHWAVVMWNNHNNSDFLHRQMIKYTFLKNLRTANENPIRAQNTSSSANRYVLLSPYYTLQDVTLISSGNWDTSEINSCRTPLCGFCGCHGSQLGNVSTIINLDGRLLTLAGNSGDVGGYCVLCERTIRVQSVFVMSRSRLCSVSQRDPTSTVNDSSEETLTFNIQLDYWDGSLQRANLTWYIKICIIIVKTDYTHWIHSDSRVDGHDGPTAPCTKQTEAVWRWKNS